MFSETIMLAEIALESMSVSVVPHTSLTIAMRSLIKIRSSSDAGSSVRPGLEEGVSS